MDFQAQVSRLERSPEYYDGLQKRLGWDVRDGRSMLIHLAGVSFEGRQELLEQVRQLCSFEFTPPVRLQPEPTNQYDANAVQVLVGVSLDDLTGEATFKQVGYLPKKRCPVCARSLSGKMASSQLCPDCDTEIGLGSEWEEVAEVNRFLKELLEAGAALQVGLDNVTTPQSGTGNMGCDIWVRIP